MRNRMLQFSFSLALFLFSLWSIKRFENYFAHKPLRSSSMAVGRIITGWQFSTPFPVDVVYTWVNGSELTFQENLRRFKDELKQEGLLTPTNEKSLGQHRFADYDTLRYSLRSLEKHANWIRHIFIVTNGQIPQWLNLQNPRVTIVTHNEIFDKAQDLPTFSANAIEHNIHKIAGLSERFLYINDDHLMMTKISLEDFYTQEKGTKFYQAWSTFDNCSLDCNIKMIQNGVCDDVCNYDHCAWDAGDCGDIRFHNTRRDMDTAHFIYRITIFYTHAIYSRAFGYKERRSSSHAPIFVEKRIKNDLDKRFPDEVYKTIHGRFRNPLEFQFHFSYMNFLMDAYNNSVRFEPVIDSPDIKFFRVTSDPNRVRTDIEMVKKTKCKFLCINDNANYSYPLEAKKSTELVKAFLQSMFPEPSSFEIHNGH